MFLTKKQVSSEFGVSVRTIDRLTERGLLRRAPKQGKFVMFFKSDITEIKRIIEIVVKRKDRQLVKDRVETI